MSQVKVTAFWDPDAEVWCAHSEDVPGLILEADTVQELVSELEEMIPAMMQENGIRVEGKVEFDLDAQYHGTAHALEA
jgi:predicted RNase H-like HicB family nuclease